MSALDTLIKEKPASFKMDKSAKVAVVGLGYVGLPLAVEFGKHRDVVGYDIDHERIDELRRGSDRTKELTQAQLKSAKKLCFTDGIESLSEMDIYIVTVPTPIDKANQPDLKPLMAACAAIGKIISQGNLVVFESTVYPGCTEEVCVPIIEQQSGLVFNQDFFCGYSPERMNPGDKVKTITQIKKITSGSTPKVGEFVDELYASIIEAGTYLAPSIKVAEAAKVIENTQRDLNIALVNELSVIFERLEIDTLDVLKAAESKWNFLPFRPGMVGGHCIGVDPYYLTYKAEQMRYQPQVILAGRRINDGMARYVANEFVKRMVKNGIDVAKSKVAVLGVTFKENCPDIRNSKVIDLISELKHWGIEVMVIDPWADKQEVHQIHNIRIEDIASIDEVDSVVVAVGHTEYRSLQPKALRAMCRGSHPVIADVKSLYDRAALKQLGFSVFRL